MSLKVTVFTASWCGQCPGYKASLFNNGITFEVIDADDEGAVAKILELKIQSFPATLITDEQDNIVHLSTGVGNIPAIKKVLQEHDERESS